MATRVQRARGGGWKFRLTSEERDLVRGLPALVRALVEEGDRDDPVLKRLFPSASLDDAELAAEFDALSRDELRRERLANLDAVEATIDADRLTDDELMAWVAVLNDVRLTLGVRLGVGEDTTPADFVDEGDRATYAMYGYLTWLQDDLVGALADAVEGS